MANQTMQKFILPSIFCTCVTLWAFTASAEDKVKHSDSNKRGVATARDVIPVQHTAEVAGEADANDDAARAIYSRLEELLKAREDGKTVDFRPLADQISKLLAAKFALE